MKNVPAALTALFASLQALYMADCVVIRAPVPTAYVAGGSGSPCSVASSSLGSVLLALTNSDVDLAILPDAAVPTNCTFLGAYLPQGVPPSSVPSMPSGGIYCSAIPMDKIKCSLKCGLGVDSQDIQIYPRYGLDRIYGGSLQIAARTGIFDAATVDFFRVFWSRSAVVPGAGNIFPGSTGGGVIYFAGRVADCEIGRSSLKATVNFFTELLNLDFPKNVYQPQCYFVLYGSGCCVNKAGYTFTGTVASSPDPSTGSFAVSGISKADGYFAQGAFQFTSGALNGLSMTVKSYNSNTVVPFLPLPGAPAPGDSVTLYAGCDRTMATCNSKFGNLANFPSMPFIPIPDTMLPPIVQSAGGGK
jgi:uncharacterized phage protein (TIGR02218 family)